MAECPQEEIAHCAAGVRWLTYLHQQANAEALNRKEQATTVSPDRRQQCNGTSAEVSQDCEEQSNVDAVTSQLQTHSLQQSPCGTFKSAKCSTRDDHEWMKHARQYSTVEEWFHALVRTHFKGSLKVGCYVFCIY